MTRAGNLLHEFLPADEMFDCAEAIIRVFHRLGDYKHKQQNRLKFLVKSLGWDGFRTEYENERAELALAATRRCRSIPSSRRSRRRRRGRSAVRSRSTRLPSRATATAVIGPGIVPKVEPRLDRAVAGVRRLVAHQRAAAEAGRLFDRHRHDRARRSDVGAVAAARRAGRGLRRRHGARDDGPEPRCSAGCGPRTSRRSTRVSRRPGCARPGAGTLSDVTSCPGAESCKLAVTQSRGLGRVLGDHLLERQDLVGGAARAWTSRSAAARTAAASTTSRASGSRAACKKVGAQPAPQYFVMVGGGVGDGVTTFGRLAAKIPARRCVHALERLVKLYQDQRADGESPLAFFRRVELGAVKALLADLETLPPEDGRAAGLHRPRRGQRVQSRGDGRGVQRLGERDREPQHEQRHADTNPLARFVARHDRPHAVAAARASGQRLARRRDLREGGVPEPRRIGERSRRRGDHPRRRAIGTAAARRHHPRRDVGQHRALPTR